MKMRIAIVSDTHIHSHPEKMKDIMDKYFKDADILIHAGDYTSDSVVDILKLHKNFIGVWGNNDGPYIRKALNEKEIFKAAGYKIGIFHGHGSKLAQENAYDKFKDDEVDIIIFGHNHQPAIFTKNKLLMLNPGSLTNKRREKWHSFIILDIEKGIIDARIRFEGGK